MTDLTFNLEAAQRGEAVQYHDDMNDRVYDVMQIHESYLSSTMFIIEYRYYENKCQIAYVFSDRLRMKPKPVAMMRLSNGMTYPKPHSTVSFRALAVKQASDNGFNIYLEKIGGGDELYIANHTTHEAAQAHADALNAAIIAFEVVE